MTHLFCNWKFVTLHFPSIYFSLHPFPPHLATICLFTVSVTLFLFCSFVVFLFTFHQGSPKITFLSLCMLSHFGPIQLLCPGVGYTRLLCPWDSPGKTTGMGSHDLLQRIFPTQGSNLCLRSLALTGSFFTTSTIYK